MVRVTTTVRALRAVPLRRLLAVSAVALTTANCSNAPQKFADMSGNGIDPKYGVRASKRLYNEGDEIPKGGGRRYSGKPYVVAGKTYVPREDARGYVRDGLASWYGSAFHGRMTANGEVFDRHSIAAAHPTLPLPSYARVTNLENGYSMVVRVNDRGPYHAGRVMDVSEEAARALEFHRKGTAHVRVEYVGKAAVAGSDDRKLLATLRTDGRPADDRGRVMLADLAGSEEPAPERFAKPARPALAFRPAEETAEAQPEPAPAQSEPVPALRSAPVRAPIGLASAAVAVPAAVQPTAARGAPFRPIPVARVAAANPARPAPLSLAPPPIRLAAGPAVPPHAVRASEARPSPVPVVRGGRAPETRTAAAPAAMPVSAKLAMARLAAASTPQSPPAAKGRTAVAGLAKPALRHARIAEAN